MGQVLYPWEKPLGAPLPGRDLGDFAQGPKELYTTVKVLWFQASEANPC